MFTTVITPGASGAGEWFDFELRLHNSWGGAGPTNGIGGEWDPAGGADWQTPQNADASTADVFRFAEGPRTGGDCTVEACAIPATSCWDGVCQGELPLGGDCSLEHTFCAAGLGCAFTYIYQFSHAVLSTSRRGALTLTLIGSRARIGSVFKLHACKSPTWSCTGLVLCPVCLSVRVSSRENFAVKLIL